MTTPLQHEAEALGGALPPLLVDADHLAASVSLGVHGRRRSGTGESFWQFRRYRELDTVTAIDWRQSAKSQHLYVREREWEAAQTVWFWRDSSANMDFASGTVAKRARADLLLLALAALLVRGGERVGYWAGGQPAAASRLSLSRIARILMLPPAGTALPPPAPIARGAQIVWFGDFFDEENEAVMTRLARAGIAGHLVRIVDPAEEEFPYHGRVRFEQQGAESEIFGRAERVRDAYRTRFIAHGERIAATATRLGWTATTHRTDHAPHAALIALFAAIGGI